jgi:hypothetical protein
MNIVFPSIGRRTSLAATLALSIAAGGLTSGAIATAQDGTGAATPTPPTACEIVPAAATTAATGAGSPAATPAGTTVATPASGAGSIPVTFFGEGDDEDTADSPADALTADLEAASTAIAGCLSDGRYDTLVLITGEEYRGQLIGIGAPLTDEEFALLAPALPQVPYQILNVENVVAGSDTEVTADVTYQLAHQVRLSTWHFELQEVQGTDAWVLQSETSMSPVAPENTDTLTVAINGDGYAIEDATVSGPSVAIEASNSADVDHEVLVLRLDDDVTTDDLLTTPGPSLPQGANYVGQATVPAGGSGTLLLSGLQPGTYTIVDLLPNASGLPNLTDGMAITFEVE